MLSIILSWVMQPKNAIITFLTVSLLFLGCYNKYLNYKLNDKENTIISLNKEVFNLKSNIQLQNDSIKKMNDDFKVQKENFEKEYKDLQEKNKVKNKVISKQESYKTPENVKTIQDEVDESRKLILEFKKSRG